MNNTIVLDDSFKQLIAKRIPKLSRIPITNPNLIQAAVAFTILSDREGGAASFLLTRRPRKLKRHGGQYALPGGKLDNEESAIQAALRELNEEIGINVSEDNVLGLLDDYSTRSGFNITPVVIWAGVREKLNPSPTEVASVYRIPISELTSPAIPYTEESEDGNSQILAAPIESLGHRIFAPTAAFIFQFREVVLFERPTRSHAHYDQPRFAWR